MEIGIILLSILVLGIVLVPFLGARQKFNLARLHYMQAIENLEELKILDPQNSMIYDLQIYEIKEIKMKSLIF